MKRTKPDAVKRQLLDLAAVTFGPDAARRLEPMLQPKPLENQRMA
jgi:hypothetical protein